MSRPSFFICNFAFIAFCAFSGHINAGIVHAEPENYLDKLKSLVPGDVLALKAGIYTKGLPIHNIHGRKDAHISVTGISGGRRAVFWGASNKNIISIVNSDYVDISNLELNGRGHFIDGVKAEGYSDFAHHITLDNLLIHNFKPAQQAVGISTKCPAYGWVIRNNIIVGVGTGMYLGNSNGRAPFIAGLIENNIVVDTVGYNLQIKHQHSHPPLPKGISTLAGRTIIRRNVFAKRVIWPDSSARPNVLVGHFPLSGHGSGNEYLIYGNFFYQNPHEALFQGEGNIALYNNIFYNSYKTIFPAVAIQRHHDRPKKIHIFQNTIMNRHTGISITGADDRYQQTVISNVVFADSPIVGGVSSNNFTNQYDIAPQYLRHPFGPLAVIDLYPQKGKLLSAFTTEKKAISRFPDFDRDFDNIKRTTGYPGAYSGKREGPLKPLGTIFSR